MKNIIRTIFFSTLMMAVFASCKKDETKVSYDGGTNPELTASSTADIVLSKSTATREVLTFWWTNPEYQFSTGINSQDVTYYLQVDISGSNFTTANNTGAIVIAKNLSIALTDSILNSAIAKIGENGLEVDVPHRLDFRIKSTINGGGPVLYSNVVTITVTPYLDVAVPIPPTGDLYLTGSGAASGWTNNPPLSQKFTQVSPVEYSIIVPLQPGNQIKFLSTLNNWQPQYGKAIGAADGVLGWNFGPQGDPDAINTPGTAGTYKITVQFVPGKYKFDLQ